MSHAGANAQWHLSPSGRYQLVVTSKETKPGCWNYTTGAVRRIGDGVDELIAAVERNYSSFPFLFIEDHPSGHSFLVCGANYQGQTIIDLTAGTRRDFVPPEAAQGHGFCWAEHRFDAASKILIVNGCYWAAPYEYKFFDFSNPMRAEGAKGEGWPELETTGFEDEMGWFYSSDLWPTISVEDGTHVYVVCYQMRIDDDDDDGDGDDGDGDEAMIESKPEPVASCTFRRDGARLVFTEGWVSDKEKARRIEWHEGQARYKAKWVAFRASDPLYLAYLDYLKSPVLSPASHEGTGITHEGWAPKEVFVGDENRICRRIVGGAGGTSPITIDLEWGTEKGPVKLVIYRDGKHVEDKFFEHLVTGMSDAFFYAERLVKES